MAAILRPDIGPRIILYRAPSHRRPGTPIMITKRASYLPGEYPTQLEPFAGQVREAPVKCEGKTGQEYRLCLIEETATVRKPVEEKRARRKAYAKAYREALKKRYPRKRVAPRVRA
jgi:hypothetical protein